MIFEPAIPIPWIVCIAVAVLGAGAYHQFRSARRLGPVRNTFLLVTRLSALAAILFLLLQPSREERVPVPAREQSVIFAVDVSASMAEAHRDGTSRLDGARADLEAAGVLLGEVNNAAPHNRKGNKEHEGVRGLNDRIMARYGADWKSPPHDQLPLAWTHDELAEGLTQTSSLSGSGRLEIPAP